MSNNNKTDEMLAINILKYILCTFIIMQHTIPMTCYSKNYFTYGILHMPLRLSVPLFFLISSYFFFINVNKDYGNANKVFRVRIAHLIMLYAIWSAIHFIVNMYDWFSEEPFNIGMMKWHLIYVVAWGKFGILWFLYSLIVGITLTYIMSKCLPKSCLVVIAFIITIFIVVGDAWYGLIIKNDVLCSFYDSFYTKFVSMRSGCTYGLLFGIIGYLLAEKELLSPECKEKSKISMILCICSFLMYSFEGFITFRLGYPKEYGLWFFSVPTTILIFCLVKKIKISNAYLTDISIFFRKSKLTSLIYFIHTLFIFVWDRAFANIGSDNELYRGILGCVFVYVFSNYISILIYSLSNTRFFRFLKYLS